jgi:hypothetical protein
MILISNSEFPCLNDDDSRAKLARISLAVSYGLEYFKACIMDAVSKIDDVSFLARAQRIAFKMSVVTLGGELAQRSSDTFLSLVNPEEKIDGILSSDNNSTNSSEGLTREISRSIGAIWIYLTEKDKDKAAQRARNFINFIQHLNEDPGIAIGELILAFSIRYQHSIAKLDTRSDKGIRRFMRFFVKALLVYATEIETDYVSAGRKVADKGDYDRAISRIISRYTDKERSSRVQKLKKIRLKNKKVYLSTEDIPHQGGLDRFLFFSKRNPSKLPEVRLYDLIYNAVGYSYGANDVYVHAHERSIRNFLQFYRDSNIAIDEGCTTYTLADIEYELPERVDAQNHEPITHVVAQDDTSLPNAQNNHRLYNILFQVTAGVYDASLGMIINAGSAILSPRQTAASIQHSILHPQETASRIVNNVKEQPVRFATNLVTSGVGFGLLGRAASGGGAAAQGFATTTPSLLTRATPGMFSGGGSAANVLSTANTTSDADANNDEFDVLKSLIDRLELPLAEIVYNEEVSSDLSDDENDLTLTA